MLIFQAVGSDEETYIDPSTIIAIEDKGDAGTLVHLSGGQTIVVDVLPAKIVAHLPQAAVSVRMPSRIKLGV